jgi:hypothetical protein
MAKKNIRRQEKNPAYFQLFPDVEVGENAGERSAHCMLYEIFGRSAADVSYCICSVLLGTDVGGNSRVAGGGVEI